MITCSCAGSGRKMAALESGSGSVGRRKPARLSRTGVLMVRSEHTAAHSLPCAYRYACLDFLLLRCLHVCIHLPVHVRVCTRVCAFVSVGVCRCRCHTPLDQSSVKVCLCRSFCSSASLTAILCLLCPQAATVCRLSVCGSGTRKPAAMSGCTEGASPFKTGIPRLQSGPPAKSGAYRSQHS